MSYPRLMRVAQHFEAPTVDDIPGTVRDQLARLNLSARVKPGQSIAIPVGSRGIANIALIVKSLVQELKSLGGKPFLVPAMGSHGGGVAENQQGIIESYGVTEAFTGAPIRATMETVEVGRTPEGVPVHFDRFAFEADHVAVVGRVKLHTGFNGEIESGLHKMMLIGLGKHRGAAIYHQAIIHYSWDRMVRSVARTVIEKCRVLFGLGIVENQYDQTALIEAVEPAISTSGKRYCSSQPGSGCRVCPLNPSICWWWTGSARTLAGPAWTPMSSAANTMTTERLMASVPGSPASTSGT